MNIFERIFLAVSVLTERDRDEKGAAMVEYGLLVALIAVVVAVAVGPLGEGIAALFDQVTATL